MSFTTTIHHKLTPRIYSFRIQRLYSTSSHVVRQLGPRRALVYKQTGNPSDVLYSTTNTHPISLGEDELLVKFLLAPVNPADLNVIEGVYPSKPTITKSFDKGDDLFVAGHEGVAKVVRGASSAGRERFEEGDWVVMRKPQSGTWTNWKVVKSRDVIRIPKKKEGSKVTDVFGATMMVNLHTALGLLKDVDPVEPGQYILQNGANSGVGQALIQTASLLDVKSINFIRSRPPSELNALKDHLMGLGAEHVFTYEELVDKGFKKVLKGLGVEGEKVRHAFNGIGGESATSMAALLGPDGHLISYGGMSKQPLKIPVGLQIFKNLTCHGYWHSRVWDALPHEEQQKRLELLTGWKEEGKLQDPLHEIIHLTGSDEQITTTMKDALSRLQAGKLGKKLLLKWDSPE